jgi:hypothetical protein
MFILKAIKNPKFWYQSHLYFVNDLHNKYCKTPVHSFLLVSVYKTWETNSIANRCKAKGRVLNDLTETRAHGVKSERTRWREKKSYPSHVYSFIAIIHNKCYILIDLHRRHKISADNRRCYNMAWKKTFAFY